MCSVYSGKADLFDTMSGLGGWFDHEGNPVDFNSSVGVMYSDEYLDFLEFRRETGGKLYQHQEVKVTEQNQDLVASHCKGFEIIQITESVEDKRTKTGTKEKVSYKYRYFGKEYSTLKELNKHKVYVTVEIPFNTMLDLIPYYPYLVTFSYFDKETNNRIVYISNESYPKKRQKQFLESGCLRTECEDFYTKELQNHYRDVVLKYYNPEGLEEIEEVTFDKFRRGFVSAPINENFEVQWVFPEGTKPHWTNPKVIDHNTGELEISVEDYTNFIGKTCKVYYVRQTDYPLNLN